MQGFKLRAATSYSSGPFDLPTNYTEAREAFLRSSKRRGGARFHVAHNTTMRAVCQRCHRECDLLEDGTVECAYHSSLGAEVGVDFALRLHDTDIVRWREDGSVRLDSGGWQTKTTRDRWNRCGIRVGMDGGVPWLEIKRAGGEVESVPYRDRVTYSPVRGAWDPLGSLEVVGSFEEIKRRRRRLLARERRANRQGFTDNRNREVYFYWDTRAGGYSPYRGTVPEAFKSDSELGLK